MSGSELHAETASCQINRHGEKICGDNFVSRSYAGGTRVLAVLADGLGHGIKAHILASYTSNMVLNFIASHDDAIFAARMMLRMLPVCQNRGISYSTFTLLDIDTATNRVKIVNHDNPDTLLLRENMVYPLEWSETTVSRDSAREVILKSCEFTARPGDRVVMVSDGVTQSGQAGGGYRFGWALEGLAQYVGYLCNINKTIGSADLCAQVVSRSRLIEEGNPSDDTSCATVYFRAPRSLMLISCPPSTTDKNTPLAEMTRNFEGNKIICGHPVAQILADELEAPLIKMENSTDPLAAPIYALSGFDMVTEGIIVLNRVSDILENKQSNMSDKADVAGKVARTLLSHDRIEMVIGLRKSIDLVPGKPDIFDLRRDVLRRIAFLLETTYQKKVTVTYI